MVINTHKLNFLKAGIIFTKNIEKNFYIFLLQMLLGKAGISVLSILSNNILVFKWVFEIS